jgi:hypothetical protein
MLHNINQNNSASINIIINEISNIYDSLTENNMKYIEKFEVLPITDRDISDFQNTIIRFKSEGINIDFTINELYEVGKKFEINANLLSPNERTSRKKILIFVLLNLNMKKNLMYNNVNNFFSNVIENPNQSFTIQQMKNNVYASYDLLINIIELFIKEINDIDNPKICPTCPTCPICPTCPTCQECQKCQTCQECQKCQTCQKCQEFQTCPICPTCPTCQECQKCQTCQNCQECQK